MRLIIFFTIITIPLLVNSQDLKGSYLLERVEKSISKDTKGEERVNHPKNSAEDSSLKKNIDVYTTKDLQRDVINSMNSDEQFTNYGVIAKSLVLAKRTDNFYDGVLKTSEPCSSCPGRRGEVTYKVEVTYDGEIIVWYILG